MLFFKKGIFNKKKGYKIVIHLVQESLYQRSFTSFISLLLKKNSKTINNELNFSVTINLTLPIFLFFQKARFFWNHES